MRPLVIGAPLACLAACTLLNSESGLVGPPLGSPDAGGDDGNALEQGGDGGVRAKALQEGLLKMGHSPASSDSLAPLRLRGFVLPKLPSRTAP